MRRKRYLVGILVAGLATGIGIALLMSRAGGVAHQRPYSWDAYALPRMEFTQQPIAQVVQAVNDAVGKASHGALKQVVFLDVGPTTVAKFASDDQIAGQMDQLMADFKGNEEELARRGAWGSGNTKYTGTQIERHSVACLFMMVASETGLEYSERQDGIHLSRPQAQMECRAYPVSPKLLSRMEEMRRLNVLHVDAEPIVSALIDVTGIHSWSVMIPDGPDSASSDFRYNKVFRYLPEKGIILAIASSEEHAQAMKRMAAPWPEVTTQPSFMSMPVPSGDRDGAGEPAH